MTYLEMREKAERRAAQEAGRDEPLTKPRAKIPVDRVSQLERDHPDIDLSLYHRAKDAAELDRSMQLSRKVRDRLTTYIDFTEEILDRKRDDIGFNNPKYIATMLASRPDAFGRHILCDAFNGGSRTSIVLAGTRNVYRLGGGYYGESEDGSDSDGLTWKRSHTPDGVFPREVGLGTTLYSCMAMGAYCYRDAQGVYSDGGSSSAERWWENALRHGYAEMAEDAGVVFGEEKEKFVEEEFDETLDLTLLPEWEQFKAGKYGKTLVKPITTTLDACLSGWDLSRGKGTIYGVYVSAPKAVLYYGNVVNSAVMIELNSEWARREADRRYQFTFDLDHPAELDVTLIYGHNELEYSENHIDMSAVRLLSAYTAAESPFTLFGLYQSEAYNLSSSHTQAWLPSNERRTVNQPTGIFRKKFNQNGYAQFTKTQAEFATRAFHGKSPFLALSLMQAIATGDEDLAVAYASRPDISPMIGRNEVAMRIIEHAAMRRQLPLPFAGLGVLSLPALREVKSRLGLAAAGVPELGPEDNPFNLPKLSAAAVKAAAKFNFD